jgi:hypothetical protein
MRITDEMVERAVDAFGTDDHPRVERERRMVNALAAALQSVPDVIRKWDFHSDEEIDELAAAVSDRANKLALPDEIHRRALALQEDLLAERHRRKGGYKGPGVYNVSGQETEVLGDIPSPAGRLVIYRRPDLANLGFIALEAFDLSEPKHQFYLRPLPGTPIA